MAEEKVNNPESTENTESAGKGADERVEVNGRKFDSWEEAAREMAKSYKEAHSTLTPLQQKNAELRDTIDFMNTQNEEVEKELPEEEEEEEGEKEEVETPQQPESEFNWDNPTESIRQIVASEVMKLNKVRDTKEAKLDMEERIQEGRKEIFRAQSIYPELKKDEELTRINDVLLNTNPDYMERLLGGKYPEAVKKAGDNRVLLAHFYLQMQDGTLEDNLKKEETRKPDKSKSFTEGGSSAIPPKVEMSKEEFFKLPKEKQTEHLRKEMLKEKG